MVKSGRYLLRVKTSNITFLISADARRQRRVKNGLSHHMPEDCNMEGDLFLLLVYIGGFTAMLVVPAAIIEFWEKYL